MKIGFHHAFNTTLMAFISCFNVSTSSLDNLSRLLGSLIQRIFPYSKMRQRDVHVKVSIPFFDEPRNKLKFKVSKHHVKIVELTSTPFNP